MLATTRHNIISCLAIASILGYCGGWKGERGREREEEKGDIYSALRGTASDSISLSRHCAMNILDISHRIKKRLRLIDAGQVIGKESLIGMGSRRWGGRQEKRRDSLLFSNHEKPIRLNAK